MKVREFTRQHASYNKNITGILVSVLGVSTQIYNQCSIIKTPLTSMETLTVFCWLQDSCQRNKEIY